MTLELFLALPKEKRDAILDAAMDEFIQFGYDMASTNRIVEKAGISKGVLFKYFGSKEDLFLYLCKEISEEKAKWMVAEGMEMPKDLFGILKFFTIHEVNFAEKSTKHYYLYQRIRENPNHPVSVKALALFKEKGGNMLEGILQRLPLEELREGVSLQDTLEMIQWVSDGYAKNTQIDMQNPAWKKQFLKDWDKIFDLLKYGLGR